MFSLVEGVPAQHDFYMPGEHAPQDAVVLIWPHRPDNWRDNGKHVQAEFVDLVSTIASETKVVVCVAPEHRNYAETKIPPQVELITLDSDDCWARDIAPTYVVNGNGERRGINWQFNAWGGLVDGLYSPWDKDAAFAKSLLHVTGEPCYDAPFILEGGSIHSDGEGTVYTTEECLLSAGRNPHLTRAEIEAQLARYLNISKVIWLKRGVFEDETNGHVDNIIHVIKPAEVVITWCDDANDPMYDICREGLDILANSTDAKGRKITVHKLPHPGPFYMTDSEAAGLASFTHTPREGGARLAGSYANFLITNKLVVVPKFGCDTDQQAVDILQSLFPDRRVVGVMSKEILLGGGNIHCFTQQIPTAV